jgi:hypothetical protein
MGRPEPLMKRAQNRGAPRVPRGPTNAGGMIEGALAPGTTVVLDEVQLDMVMMLA